MADDLFARMWAARPWKDYATNPPSMAPQLGIALGLLGPRVMGAPVPRQAPAPLPQLQFPAVYKDGNMAPMVQESLNQPFLRYLKANPPTPANGNAPHPPSTLPPGATVDLSRLTGSPSRASPDSVRVPFFSKVGQPPAQTPYTPNTPANYNLRFGLIE